MHILGIGLLVAWITVGYGLVLLPEKQLELELAATQRMLEELEDSPILKIPEVKSQIDSSKHFLVDPSSRRIVIWAEWSALLLLVMFGMWSAFAVIRRHSGAMALALTGAILFLGREATFHGALYKRLLEGTNEISVSLENGYYQFAASFAWYHRVLPIFFLLAAIFCCIQLVQSRPSGSRPA